MNYRTALTLAALLVVFVFSERPALALTHALDHGGTYWGDVVVDRDEVVQGDMNVLFGSATIEGRINGNLNVFGGGIDVRPGAEITGQTNAVGGGYAQALAPWVPAEASLPSAGNSRVALTLAYSAVVVLFFLIFPVRVRIALDRVEQHPGLSAAVGVLALVAVFPIALLLFVSFIGWPLIPLEILAVAVGIFIGQAALGMLVGRRLYELIRPHATPAPLAALVLGLALLAAAEMVPIAGYFVLPVVWFIGLGATILAFIREGSSLGAPRQPISGPPMNRA